MDYIEGLTYEEAKRIGLTGFMAEQGKDKDGFFCLGRDKEAINEAKEFAKKHSLFLVTDFVDTREDFQSFTYRNNCVEEIYTTEILFSKNSKKAEFEEVYN